MTNEQLRRRQFIQGLRAVAEFYEKNPAAWYDGMHLTLNMYVWGRAARKALIETARLFGHCNKIYDDNNITVSRQFSEQVTVAVFAARARVCRRVVLGARILPERIVPATSEVRIPASRVEIDRVAMRPFVKGRPTRPLTGFGPAGKLSGLSSTALALS